MAIAAGNNTTQDLGTTPATVTITMPTGANSSSVVVVVIGAGNDSATGSMTRYTPPTGWTSIGFQNTNNNFGSGGQHPMMTEAWWSLGNNTNLVFTANNGTGGLSATKPKYVGVVAVNFTGVDTSNPIDATGTANDTTASNTATANDITTVTDQALEVIGGADWNTAGGAYSCSGFTPVDNAGANNATALLYSNTAQTPAGSTGTKTVTASGGTASNQDIHLIPFALRPAGSSGGILYIDNLFNDIFSSNIISGIQ